jgi:uncharacterized membrane protein
MINNVIAWVLENAFLVLFALSCLLGIVGFVRRANAKKGSVWEPLTFWLLLLFVGFGGIYGFVTHGFMGEIAAKAIGWADSPFQWEVAVANLVFGVLGVLAAFSRSRGFRFATIVGFSVWFWGDAAGHVYQMITADDFAPGNAGTWFWLDVVTPAIMLVLHAANRKS